MADRSTSPPSAAGLAGAVGVYAASRVVVVLAAGVGARLNGELTLLQALTAWDGLWYLRVAASGYPDVAPRVVSNVADAGAFFPLYPLLIRGFAFVTGLPLDVVAVGLATSLGGVVAALLWLLVSQLDDDERADRAVALFSFFPGSFVLSMAYAEGLLLALVVACLLALRARRWFLAGALAALATASRPNGLVVGACCAWAAACAWRRDSEPAALVAPALAPLGILAFFGYLWARTGEPAAWLLIQRYGWGEQLDLGRRTFAEVAIVARDPGQLGLTVAVGGLVVAVVGAVALARWRPPAELVLWTAGVLGLAVLSRTLQVRPRFLLTAFPLVVALARPLRGTAFAAALGVSAVLLGVLTVLAVAQQVIVVP